MPQPGGDGCHMDLSLYVSMALLRGETSWSKRQVTWAVAPGGGGPRFFSVFEQGLSLADIAR